MKVLVLCALVAAAHATAVAVLHAPVVSTGTSNQYRSQDNLGNYNFGYDESHATGGTFRRETGDSFGNKFGSYGLRDIDGRQRIVNYVADAGGFRADIKTNEPGVEPKDPASTTINKAAVLVAAPAHHFTFAAAPVYHRYAHYAPVPVLRFAPYGAHHFPIYGIPVAH